MTQNQTLTKKPLAEIGEEIGIELGKRMVASYYIANPKDIQNYTIGRNILDQILAQPGCIAIKFLNAYNEVGQKTLVYVGLDKTGKSILKVTAVNIEGRLSSKNGIVADRVRTGGGGTPPLPGGDTRILPDGDDWGITTE